MASLKVRAGPATQPPRGKGNRCAAQLSVSGDRHSFGRAEINAQSTSSAGLDTLVSRYSTGVCVSPCAEGGSHIDPRAWETWSCDCSSAKYGCAGNGGPDARVSHYSTGVCEHIRAASGLSHDARRERGVASACSSATHWSGANRGLDTLVPRYSTGGAQRTARRRRGVINPACKPHGSENAPFAALVPRYSTGGPQRTG